MSTSNILVVYYSRTGATAMLAQAVASSLNANLEAIVDNNPVGYFRAIVLMLAHDLVIIGAPVRSRTRSVPVPIQSFLAHSRWFLPDVAFFCTTGGQGGECVFEEMQALVGKAPKAVCSVSIQEVESGDYAARVADFKEQIESRADIAPRSFGFRLFNRMFPILKRLPPKAPAKSGA